MRVTNEQAKAAAMKETLFMMVPNTRGGRNAICWMPLPPTPEERILRR